jgi:hypothetical protein
LGLRCGALAVLLAVVALLLRRWSRLRDDEVHIRHLTAQFPPGVRRLSATTIGRLLTQLAELELIVYRPARGRGCCAYLAIHPQFCDGVTELRRDASGRVIVDDSTADMTPATDTEPTPQTTPDPGSDRGVEGPENVKFSGPGLLIEDFPSTPLPPDANGGAGGPAGSRPTGVAVPPAAVRDVLAAAPDCYRNVAAPFRWHIGAAVHQQLARGWREDQVVAVLAAPLPDQVRKPLVLARIRFAKSLVGAGPRLRPSQRTWDRAHVVAERTHHAGQRARDYAAVIAELGPDAGRRMADAAQHRAQAVCGSWAQPATVAEQDTARRAATVHAARMARREYPHRPLRGAVAAWLAAHEPPPRPAQASAAATTDPVAPALRDLTVADLIAATPAGRCVGCGGAGAVARAELPLPTPVCAECWNDADSPTPAATGYRDGDGADAHSGRREAS